MGFSYTAAAKLALPFLSLLTTSYAQQKNTSTQTLTQVLGANANLSQFLDLLQSQYQPILNTLETFKADSNPITILAPSNNAFENVVYVPELSDALSNNDTAIVSNVIAYHTTVGAWTTNTLNTSFQWVPTMTSGTNFSLVEDGQRVGGVLQPGNKNTSSYEWEIVWVSGESTRSVVTVQDIPFAGGFIQMIDNFLVPPVEFVPTAETYNLANYDYAVTSFLGAVYSLPSNSTLPGYLNTTKDLTIFVPANEAFAASSKALESYSAAQLERILSYHVLSVPNGPIYSSDFSNGTSLTTLANTSVEMRFFSNSFFVNQARVVSSDILIYNGVFHVIDGILSPQDPDAMPNPTSATAVPVLPTNGGSVNGSDVPFTTFLPDYVNTAAPTVTASETLDAGAAATMSGYTATYASNSATASSKKKSGAARAFGREEGSVLPFLGSWVAVGVVSAAMMCWNVL